MMAARALLLATLALLPVPASSFESMAASQNYAGSYPNGCWPNSPSDAVASPSLAYGETAYICLNINGKVTSMYNVIVDQYAAVTVSGSNYANPPGSGYWVGGAGWQQCAAVNASQGAPIQSLFTVFDFSVAKVNSDSARIYKRIDYEPVGDGTLKRSVTTYALWTVIINLNNGVITNIAYDDGCFFCASNTPQCGFTAFDANATVSAAVPNSQYTSCSTDQNTCYPGFSPIINASACASYPEVPSTDLGNSSATNATTTNSSLGADTTTTNSSLGAGGVAPVTPLRANSTIVDTGCDLKVFITWTGTDRNGAYLTSANKRFSRYRAFAVATAFQSAVNVGNNAFQLGSTALGVVEGIPGQVIPAANED